MTVSISWTLKRDKNLRSTIALDASLQYLYSSNECYTGSGSCGTLGGYSTLLHIPLVWEMITNSTIQRSKTLLSPWVRLTLSSLTSWILTASLMALSPPLMVASHGPPAKSLFPPSTLTLPVTPCWALTRFPYGVWNPGNTLPPSLNLFSYVYVPLRMYTTLNVHYFEPIHQLTCWILVLPHIFPSSSNKRIYQKLQP